MGKFSIKSYILLGLPSKKAALGLVLLKLLLSIELRTANIATEMLSALMVVHVVLRGESLMTYLAGKRFVTRMDSHVVFQGGFLLENFATAWEETSVNLSL